MDRSDIPFLSATELSALIAKREVSPVEATESYLDRIEGLDFKFNAYLTVLRRQALEAAREAEQSISRGSYLGPMHGIPVAVKDQLWTKGIRTTGGTRLRSGFVPTEDATAIANLKRAGAILLGKTNLTEFALTGFTQVFSHPRNPWDLDTFAGGSSGGSAAATGAFLCATSLGEDTAGSIRMPAAWCGLVGLRPTWGRVSRYGLMRGIWSMDTAGPISRTVEDAAITLGAIAGQDPKDPYTWNSPVPDYRQALDGDVKDVRVGLVSELTDNPLVDTHVREALAKATSVLEGLGASVEEVSIPLTRHEGIIASAWLAAEPPSDHMESLKNRLNEYGHDTRVRLVTGAILPAQAYYKAQQLRRLLRNEVLRALERYHVLVMPTSGKVAQPVEEDPVITSVQASSRLPYLFTRTFAVINGPAISLPCGLSPEGLPIGLQIGGRPGGDDAVLKVAHAYEQATAWHTMRPPFA